MPTDYLPRTDEGLQTWAANYSELITATPVPLGLSAAIATTLAGKLTVYSDALTAAKSAPTRGGSTVAAKEMARKDLVSYIRQTARQVQGTMTVTDQQRYDLGLTVRKTEPTPIPVPDQSPLIQIKSVVGRTVRIRLKDSTGAGRGKPPGCIGAQVMTCVSETTPTPSSNWVLQGLTSRVLLDLVFPDTVPAGATVWVSAAWYNTKSQAGMMSVPISTNLQGGAAAEVA